jgi:hypothetical protein
MFDLSVVDTSSHYDSTGQELGETRKAMCKRLMEYIEETINLTLKKFPDSKKFWILVHAKPYPGQTLKIKQKIMVMFQKPSMMLSCMLFEYNNEKGVLRLMWSLPGDWPTWSVGGTNEPIPEVVASLKELSLKYDVSKILKL